MGAYEYDYNQDWASDASIIYVNDDASGSNDGTSWTDAYTSLQTAITNAVADDQIWIASGTYKPETEVGGTGDRYKAFQMKNSVEIFGGFDMTEHGTAHRSDYGLGGANETILSGDIGTQDDNSDNCYHVFTHTNTTGLDNTAVLDGVTITKGNANGTLSNTLVGGGMYNSYCGVTLNNVTFNNNSSTEKGGGLCLYTNSTTIPTIDNCTISNNSSTVDAENDGGGGIFHSGDSLILNNCTLSNNTSANEGGGILSYSASTLNNCIISNNTAKRGGGSVHRYNTTTYINCFIEGNESTSSGGGMYCTANGDLYLTNCVISENTSGVKGGGLYTHSSGGGNIVNCTFIDNTSGGGWNTSAIYLGSSNQISVKNTIVFGNICSTYKSDHYQVGFYNSNTVSNSDIEGCGGSSNWAGSIYGTDGGNNIDSDPRFVGSTLNSEHPYSIFYSSPCCDAGNNTAISESYDIRGEGYDRIVNKGSKKVSVVDMGAYEYKSGSDPSSVRSLTWEGSINNDWTESLNWNFDNITAYPGSDDDLSIPNVGNDPVLSSDASANCNDLTIENGATFTIQSDANGVGSLITNGIITNNGTVNIERYVSESVWHFISSPNNVSTANTFDSDYLQTWDETTASWTDITEASTALTPVKGYSFWGTPSKAATYTFSGTPNTGNQSLALTYTEVVGYGNDGANLLGNPYPSSIDWSGLDDTWGAVYYWNGTQYATWNDGSATNGGVQYIPPMQGFFIMVSTSGTFSLTNSNRTHEGASAYFKATEELSANSILLEAKSGGLTDELFIRIDNEATEDFELTRDAYKFPSDVKGLSQVYSFAGEKTLSIDVRPETEVIQLGFQNDENGIYSIGIKEISDLTGVKLEDTKTGTFHDLQSGSYEFAWSIIDNEKRFKLHLNALGIEDDIAQQNQILIYSSGNTIYFKNLESTKDVQMRISDITGRIVLEKNIQSSGLVSIPTNLKSGIYIVSVINENEIQTEKVIIN